MKIGIIGGGIMGVCLGYFLSHRGYQVEIFEASPTLGGLAGPISLEDGTKIDRFYHAILSSDNHLRQLCAELGISDRLRFRGTRMGFFYNRQIHSMNNIIEFLRFPPLGWVDRFRLGLTVLYAQLIRDWEKLEGISVEKWLVQIGGRRTYENIWLPMLKAKFDGDFQLTPATYIWARLVRMKSTRSGANQKEMAGHLIGGYITLIQALADRIIAAGGKIHLRKPVNKIIINGGEATGILTGDEIHTFDKLISTMQPPIFRRMIPDADSNYLEFLSKTKYLGIVCPIMILDRPLSEYWTLYLTDDGIPFTGIIETTSYIKPEYVGGHHLIYLPKYTAPESSYQTMSDDEIKEKWLSSLEAMFPDFNRRGIQYFLVHRERYVEPLHPVNSTDLIPPVKTPIKNLFLATTAQIYPELTNGESVSAFARTVAQLVIEN